MKLLHAACLLNPSIGVLNQIEWENRAANKLNLSFDSVICTTMDYDDYEITNNMPVKGNSFISYFLLRFFFWKWLINTSSKYDVILLRYSIHDPFQWAGTFFLRKYITVHHTFEIEEINTKDSKVSKLLVSLEKYFGKSVLNRSYGIIGVTNEILEYEFKRIKNNDKCGFVYPNGIETEIYLDDLRYGTTPEIIFVAASFTPWIGLDLLIDSIQNSEKVGEKFNFKIHLVGEIGSKDAQRIKNDSRFIIHGTLNSVDLDILYSKCWIALSSFGFYRKKMKEACTLKTREYLSRGIPTIGGYDEVGFPKNFKYYKKIKCNINKILEFANLHQKTNRQTVIHSSMKYIKKEKLLSELISQLKD